MHETRRDILVTRSSMPPFDEFVEAIRPLWDSHWLTNMGALHRELEERLRVYLGVDNLSLMVNGHLALELAIQSFGFPDGAEVITTPFTFISTTHAIVRNRLHPVFCDVKPTDGTIDETKIEQLITEKTVAILPVHVYGNVCAVDTIQEIADRYSLKVIYDAAHAFGETHRGVGVGTFGDASIFSFHATKAYNTIEGGAVAFHEKAMYSRLYDLKNFGIRGEELVVSVGANAKMNEFAAAMGLCNLKYVDAARRSRARAHDRYMKELAGVRGIHFFDRSPDTSYGYAYFPIIVTDEFRTSRDVLYSELKEVGVHARKYFYPLTSDQACFKNKYKGADLAKARDLADRILVLPLFEGMEDEDVLRIIGVIKEVARPVDGR